MLSNVYHVLGDKPPDKAYLSWGQRTVLHCLNNLIAGLQSHLGESLRGTSWKAPLGILSLPPAALGCRSSMWASRAAEAEACALKSALTAPLMLPVLDAAPRTDRSPCLAKILPWPYGMEHYMDLKECRDAWIEDQ